MHIKEREYENDPIITHLLQTLAKMVIERQGDIASYEMHADI